MYNTQPVFRRTAALIALTLTLGAPARATTYATFHFDNARDGWNNHETQLTQASVRELAKIQDIALDGEVDAQPLYANGVAYVVTENDTLYAVSPSQGILWSRSFGAPVTTGYVGNCRATAPTIGIQGTPVIDAKAGRLYLVSFTLEHAHPVYTLHAVTLKDGTELASADLTRRVVDPSAHRQRSALLLHAGHVYVAFAGFCDHHADVSYGRVFSFTAADLRPAAAFVTTASPKCGSFHLGTIWGLGFGPAAYDSHIFFSTGNGCMDYSTTRNGGYGNTVLRLTADLRLESTQTGLFASCNSVAENEHDQEMGSGGVIFAPGTRFLIAGGKTGITYSLDPENLGGYHPHCPDHVPNTTTSWGVWGGPVAWSSSGTSYVAVAGLGPHGVRTYTIDRKTGALTLRSETGVRLNNGGESLVVTSDETGSPASTVLWALTRPTTGTMELDAYDPTHMRTPLFAASAGEWGNPAGYAGTSPTAVDGMVFVASNKRLTIWSIKREDGRLWYGVLVFGAALLVVGAGVWRRRVRRSRR